MRPTIEELLEKNLPNLTSAVRDVLNDQKTETSIQEIGSRHNLDEIDTDLLREEVAYVLFKVTPLDEFKDELRYNLNLDDSISEKISIEITDQIFRPIRKFLKETKTVQITPKDPQAIVEKPLETNTQKDILAEDLNHHDILSEIEAPTPSIKNVDTNIEGNTAIKVMSKEAQDLIKLENTNTETTTKAPTLQEAIGNMPDIGGFIPVNNVLAPSQKVAENLDSKLKSVSTTPIKEVFVPKRLDPYREPIE